MRAALSFFPLLGHAELFSLSLFVKVCHGKERGKKNVGARPILKVCDSFSRRLIGLCQQDGNCCLHYLLYQTLLLPPYNSFFLLLFLGGKEIVS
jgi:hypothetical protein